ncbi:ogr/Delta-like zinc finger family protein [Pragia fontium]|uniref:Ogr/Delta-like zinc finger n=1 Tax=Pragia fontium DSM 5563 = ATCC 49100 TaxID=1122977 RepID=A0AAJ4W9I0_9GAMM|nr:Ogr/Delta-like zinc finger [Pragia fontium DSM 5563 = ATCC 49100]
MRVMKIICPECGVKATIKKTNRKHEQLSDIYCYCSDVECGHTFVMNVSFSHTLSPSAKSKNRIVKDLISWLTPDQKQMALDLLNNPA